MKKVFISQPMAGKSDEQILRERQQAVSYLRDSYGEIDIIDSFFRGTPHTAKPLWFLGKSLELLADADVAYFCDGWEDARGCRIEHDAALAYGIPEVISIIDHGKETKE